MLAEDAFLFRHVILRDAAYQMQVPRDRALLHRHALQILDSLADGPGPLSLEIAEHAGAAAEFLEHDAEPLQRRELSALQEAADYAAGEFDNARAAACYDRCADHPLADPETRCIAWIEAGHIHLLVGRPDLAEKRFQSALKLAELEGLEGPRGEALNSLGLAAQQTSRLNQSERYLREALELFTRLGDRSRIANVLYNLASLNPRGHHESRKFAEQALRIHRELGERGREGIVLGNLAVTCMNEGNVEEAEKLYRESIAIHREVGNRRFEGITLGNLASLLKSLGRDRDSREMLLQALELLREVGDRRSQGHILGNLPLLDKRAGRLTEAERGYYEAIAVLREVGERRLEAFALGNLAFLLHITGRLQAANDCFRLCLENLEQIGDRVTHAVFCCLHARIRLLEGDVEGAAGLAAAAAQVLIEGPHRLEYLLQLKVRLGVERGKLQDARANLAEMEELLREFRLAPGSDGYRAVEVGRQLLQGKAFFRGHLQSELEPVQRLALAAQMRSRGESPPLGLLDGTEGLKAPGWRQPLAL
jgi:tetratricopeptide (TPR) repeat protein